MLDRINREILDHGVLIKYAIPFTCTNRSQRREHPCSEETRIIQVSYADDIVLFCKSISELEKMLKLFDEPSQHQKRKCYKFHLPRSYHL